MNQCLNVFHMSFFFNMSLKVCIPRIVSAQSGSDISDSRLCGSSHWSFVNFPSSPSTKEPIKHTWMVSVYTELCGVKRKRSFIGDTQLLFLFDSFSLSFSLCSSRAEAWTFRSEMEMQVWHIYLYVVSLFIHLFICVWANHCTFPCVYMHMWVHKMGVWGLIDPVCLRMQGQRSQTPLRARDTLQSILRKISPPAWST